MKTDTRASRADHAWQALAAVGARRTAARGLVIDALAEADGHLSVTAIHERIALTRPEINVSTVHRTVAFLVEHRVAHLLPLPGEAMYGLSERPHVHAVCDICGTVSEIAAESMVSVVAEARRSSDLDISESGVALFGRCRSCRRRARRTLPVKD